MVEVMLDLETLGTRPGSAIRSVGAAAFELDGIGHVGETFYANVKSMSCWAAGLTVDQGTLDWWDRQSKEVQDALKTDQKPIGVVVGEFHGWFKKTGALRVWCQGAGFDEVLWTSVARALNSQVPWKFWNARCTRTIYDVSGLKWQDVPREGDAHNALDDALHQIKLVQMAHAMMREKRA